MILSDAVRSLEAELQEAQETIAEMQEDLAADQKALDELNDQLAERQHAKEAEPVAIEDVAVAVHDFLRARGFTEDIPWGCATAAWRVDVTTALGQVLDG